jgi:hypothetical protein
MVYSIKQTHNMETQTEPAETVIDKPNIMIDIFNNPQEHVCSICIEPMVVEDEETTQYMKSWLKYKDKIFHKPIYQTQCNHAFHEDCFLKYKYQKRISKPGGYDASMNPIEPVVCCPKIDCPYCRTNVDYVYTYTHFNIDDPCKYYL